MSKIVNSSAKDSVFTIAGSAITDTTQPDINGGAVAGVKSTSIADRSMVGYEPQSSDYSAVDPGQVEHIMRIDLNPSANETSNVGDHAREELRTRKVATAIRNDQWVEYSGVYHPAPSTSNDASATALTSDNAAKSATKTRVTFGNGHTPNTNEL